MVYNGRDFTAFAAAWRRILFGLGVNPKVIAAILRHSDISTTLQFYIQTPDAESRAALAKLEERIAARNASQQVLINGQPK